MCNKFPGLWTWFTKLKGHRHGYIVMLSDFFLGDMCIYFPRECCENAPWARIINGYNDSNMIWMTQMRFDFTLNIMKEYNERILNSMKELLSLLFDALMWWKGFWMQIWWNRFLENFWNVFEILSYMKWSHHIFNNL